MTNNLKKRITNNLAIATACSIAISLLGMTPVKTLAQSNCSTEVCSVTVVEGNCTITTTLHSDGSVTKKTVCREVNEQANPKPAKEQIK